DFDGWEVCDQACMNLFWKASFAYEKAIELADKKSEFVKRTGFALMAVLAWKDKSAKNAKLERFFPIIESQAWDQRNFVKKAVNWALRQIGKKNIELNRKAIKVAEKIKQQDTRSARWIAADALRELKSKAVQKRLS
ncbi:MAG: DNA alkylation repair protein, partial [Candidatus Altiarchaeota archaeon]|nr:DNA alkylation repair protein [Candidatus Altiarchaeota archaeon]